jgi:hypothetical protein
MGGYNRAVSGQRLGKHVPTATNPDATIEEICFLLGPYGGVVRKTIGATVLRRGRIFPP